MSVLAPAVQHRQVSSQGQCSRPSRRFLQPSRLAAFHPKVARAGERSSAASPGGCRRRSLSRCRSPKVRRKRSRRTAPPRSTVANLAAGRVPPLARQRPSVGSRWRRGPSCRFLGRAEPAAPASQRPLRVLFQPRCRNQLALEHTGQTALRVGRRVLFATSLRRCSEADEEDQGHHRISLSEAKSKAASRKVTCAPRNAPSDACIAGRSDGITRRHFGLAADPCPPLKGQRAELPRYHLIRLSAGDPVDAIRRYNLLLLLST